MSGASFAKLFVIICPVNGIRESLMSIVFDTIRFFSVSSPSLYCLSCLFHHASLFLQKELQEVCRCRVLGRFLVYWLGLVIFRPSSVLAETQAARRSSMGVSGQFLYSPLWPLRSSSAEYDE